MKKFITQYYNYLINYKLRLFCLKNLIFYYSNEKKLFF